jgi:hypothetical protein
VGTLRHLLQRALGGPRAGMPTLDDGHVLMQLRAARGFAAGLEATAERRRSLDRSRKVSDRELIARFPRLVVPTYRGDSRLFGSQAFRELLPADWSVDWLELDEVVDPSVTGGTGD